MTHRATHSKSQPHVVLFAHNKTMRIMVRVFLQKAGFRVTEAENQSQAVSLLLNQRPDVFVIDCETPHIDAEMGKQIHTEISPLKIPFIALLGRDMEHDLHRIHADGWLPKPLHMDHLVKLISELTKRSYLN